MCARINSSLVMSPVKLFILSSLLLSACAQTPPRAQSAGEAQPVVVPEEKNAEENTKKTEEKVEVNPTLPNVELSGELLYEFLLAEIANQRGDKSLAVEGSTDIARKTRDPRLAQRAAQLAAEAGDMNNALAAFKLWQEVDPSASVATRMLSSILLRGGKLDEAQAEFAKVLKEDERKLSLTFLQIYQMVAVYPDKAAALKLMIALAEPYPRVAEAHWVVAQLAHQKGDAALALSEVRQVRNLRPEWEMGVSLEAQVMNKTAPKQALEVLQQFLSRYPNARDIRLQYARALLEQKEYKSAREEFQRLSQDAPENADMAFAIALISLQMNDLSGAEAQLQAALNKGKKEQDTIQYYLGQLSEAKENEADALTHYRLVKAGEYQFSAQIRVAYLLSKQGKLDDARAALHEAQPSSNQQRVQLLLVEAQLLREAKQNEAAYKVLQAGLVKLPNHTDLLYETAMLAEKISKFDESERLLRKLIQLKPDNAHAYNALGYSLLERNLRVTEAVSLVEKALQLAPEDIAIMDSVGWGYYRVGKLDDSVKMLRRAFAANPDPEIASHLGEALWSRGDKEEAKKVWQDSLKANPDNVQLQAVIKKFIP